MRRLGVLVVSTLMLLSLSAHAQIRIVTAIGALSSPAAGTLRANTVPWPTIHAQGYYGAGTAGGGDFEYIGGSCVDNGGTIIVDASSDCYRRQLADPTILDAYMFGFVGGGASHPLSGYFSTLAAAQAIYPWAVALTDEIDGMAIQAALYALSAYQTQYPVTPYQLGGQVTCPATMWRFNETIFLPPNTALIGLGSGLNIQSLPIPLSGAASVQSCFGYWTGAALGDDLGGAAIKTLNAYQAVVPSYMGSAVSATPTTLVFATSTVPNSTFVGAILNIDSQLRTVTSGVYSSPNYTATIGNPWTTTPSMGDALSIAAESIGAPYTGIDSLAGNCLGDTFSYDNAVRVENVAIGTDNETPIGFDFHCASQAKVKNTQTIGFNVARNWDESYYIDDRDSFDVYRQDGITISGGTAGVFTDDLTWPQTVPASSPVNIYRPSASDRVEIVGSLMAVGVDPGYYISTGVYGAPANIINFVGGDIGEGADRSVFWSGASATLNIRGSFFERQGFYPVGGPAKTGAASIWQNSSNISIFGASWIRSHSGGDHMVPFANGCAPILDIRGLNPTLDDAGDGLAAPTLGYSSSTCPGSIDSFKYGGKVTVNNGTAATTVDSAPYNVNELGNGTPNNTVFLWPALGLSIDAESSGPVSLNNCNNPVAVNTASNAITVDLPSAMRAGQTCTIYDSDNNASAHHITIVSSTGNISQAAGASYTISANGGAVTVQAQATGTAGGWVIVSSH